MKGIILAGGRGTRLHPLTLGVSKQLLPVYNKPMVYYPLTTLMWAGIREVLVITTPEDRAAFERLLGDGERWGMTIQYATQDAPRGLADAFRVGRDFIGDAPSCLILGDNVFYGHGLPEQLRRAAKATAQDGGATVFAYAVKDPERYGVVRFDAEGRATGLEEKPTNPTSRYAVPGIYFYDGDAVREAAALEPSVRGELEITDLNRRYLERGTLRVEPLGRGVAWLDAGTHESLLQASTFVQAVEDRQGLLISAPEEVAFRQGFITKADLLALAEGLGTNAYSDALRAVARG